MTLRTNIIVCGSLSVLAMLALVTSHLALTDIRHGESDVSAEWMVLQIAFVVIGMSMAVTIVLLPRVWVLAGARHLAA
jgi:hypothetical protein